ncbi:MAG: cytochrome c maturation protein CcmE [Chloroflexota bacterium]
MTTTSWEKSGEDRQIPVFSAERLKFLVGGVLILAAVGVLLVSGTLSGAQYFITVDDLVASSDYVGQTIRITGAVDGRSIRYDPENLILDFTIAAIDTDTDDIALELHNAVNDTRRARIPVHLEGEVKPDLLQHEAQAILTGQWQADGVFYATELLLKCPSRYGETMPNQVAEADHAG